MVKDNYTGLGKGFAFVEFDSYQEAMHAVEVAPHGERGPGDPGAMCVTLHWCRNRCTGGCISGTSA